MRRSQLFLVFTAVGMMALAALVLWANSEGRRWQSEDLPHLQHLTARLGLTDLALWTEARYARHPSQTDLFSAFQDFPGAPEHFPAGSITGPPPALTDPAAFVAPTSRGRSRDDRGDRRRRDVGATKDPGDVVAPTSRGRVGDDQRDHRRRDVDATREPGDVVAPARSTSGDGSP